MSDISNSNSSSSSKRRLSQIDDSIECLTQEVNTLEDFVNKTEFECSLMAVKMERERIKALSAVAKSQVLLAKMEISIAKRDIFMDIERLRNFKRTKLDRNEGESQVNTSSQTSNKKNSSRKSPFCKMSSDDETVIIPSQKNLGSSTKTQECLKKSSNKKPKTDKKVKSKSKSKCVSKRIQSLTASIKTVADLRKTVNTASNPIASSHAVSSPKISRTDDKKSMATATYMPVRHNMGVRQTQSSSSTLNPYLYHNPATQANMQHHSPKSGNSQLL